MSEGAVECWLMVRAETDHAVLWQVSGYPWDIEDLPRLSPALLARTEAFGEEYWRLDAANDAFPRPHYWEQRADFPVAAFNAEGRAIACALKAALPPEWTVVYEDVDAWLRPKGTPIQIRQLILPSDVPSLTPRG